MIDESKQVKAIDSIHKLIVQARILVFENTSKENLMSYLDDLEYLPAIMLEEKDRTQLFEGYLEEMCARFNCKYIIDAYQREE